MQKHVEFHRRVLWQASTSHPTTLKGKTLSTLNYPPRFGCLEGAFLRQIQAHTPAVNIRQIISAAERRRRGIPPYIYCSYFKNAPFLKMYPGSSKEIL